MDVRAVRCLVVYPFVVSAVFAAGVVVGGDAGAALALVVGPFVAPGAAAWDGGWRLAAGAFLVAAMIVLPAIYLAGEVA